MLFYKKVFDFYIKSSLHLGFCVVSLYLVSIFKQQITVNHYVLICLFSSTIIVYNFIKYASTLPYYFFVQNAPIKKIQILSFILGCVLLFSLFLRCQRVRLAGVFNFCFRCVCLACVVVNKLH